MSINLLKFNLIKLYSFSIFMKIYTVLKIYILPLDEFLKYLPKEGSFLDFGTGFGYIANFIALDSANKNVTGIDIEADRILTAKRTIGERKNIKFICADLREMDIGKFDFITMADVLHHIPVRHHKTFMECLYDKLNNNGIFIIRDTNKKNSIKYFIMNYLAEVILYPSSERCHFYTANQLKALLEEAGFKIVKTIKSSPWFIYETVIYVCRK